MVLRVVRVSRDRLSGAIRRYRPLDVAALRIKLTDTNLVDLHRHRGEGKIGFILRLGNTLSRKMKSHNNKFSINTRSPISSKVKLC